MKITSENQAEYNRLNDALHHLAKHVNVDAISHVYVEQNLIIVEMQSRGYRDRNTLDLRGAEIKDIFPYSNKTCSMDLTVPGCSEQFHMIV